MCLNFGDMLHSVALLCVTVSLVIMKAGSKGAKEVIGNKWTTKVRPDYLKRFEHGIRFGPETPQLSEKEKKKSNATTQYVEPEFKRFCNDCEDFWHPKCFHYPHIYDDSKGCVLRTLSPKSAAEMDKSERDSDEEDGESSEYEDDAGSDDEENVEEGGERKAPEVLMKAEEMEALRQRMIEASPGSQNQSVHPNGSEPMVDERRMDAIIAEEIARKFGNSTALKPEEKAEIMKHAIPMRQTSASTTPLNAETLVFSVEEGVKVTVFKEVYDDAAGRLDTRINNALVSCPRELAISQSSIPEVQLGVWTRVALPAGVVMGPYRGKVSAVLSREENSELKTKPEEHVLQIFHAKTRQLLFVVDGRSNTMGNWCRYVNGARHSSEQNVEIFFDGQTPAPYFRTTRSVDKHTELLCDFGAEYRKDKYPNLLNVLYNLPLERPLPKRQFLCSRCTQDQGDPISIQLHRKSCNATKPKKTPRPKKVKHLTDDDDEEISPDVWTPPRHTKPRPQRPKRH